MFHIVYNAYNVYNVYNVYYVIMFMMFYNVSRIALLNEMIGFVL